MKTLKFLMVLLFTSAIFVSCGGGIEADMKKACELEATIAAAEEGSEEATKAQEEWDALDAKYNDDSEASAEDKKAWAERDCSEEKAEDEGEE